VLPTELQRAKNQFARDYIVSRESNEDKARTWPTPRSSTTTSRRRTASSTSS
jgi:hypothetical protein